ncbi:nanos homolog 2-like [Protopterus annectens]|uniref:nanos homolog 2-like n=1 Tax=Protopterus annectens TaxID=7888 RepID=UPI001CFB7C18|nr:nanos homolog 2-like [Protopterus annectens]
MYRVPGSDLQFKDFDMWKDYLQLSKVIEEMMKHRSMQGNLLPADIPLESLQDYAHLHSQSAPGWSTSVNIRKGDSKHGPNFKASDLQHKVICNFCKHNGESKRVYSSHALKKKDGTITCPILRKYVCPVCGATGDVAHTLMYCPFNNKKYSLYKKDGRNSVGKKCKQNKD